MTERCLCGALDCPRCFPALLHDRRIARNEALADYLHDKEMERYYDEKGKEDLQ